MIIIIRFSYLPPHLIPIGSEEEEGGYQGEELASGAIRTAKMGEIPFGGNRGFLRKKLLFHSDETLFSLGRISSVPHGLAAGLAPIYSICILSLHD